MPDESTPTTPSSEQPASVSVKETVEEPSQQGQAAEATQPAAEIKAPEPEPKVDIEAIRREAAERVRHDLESQYGKQLSEARRLERERARQEREQMLANLSDFVPDEQLKRARDTFTLAEQQAEKEAELAQLKAYATRKQAEEQQTVAALEAQRLVQEAGYRFEDLPKDVLGVSPEGFKERFAEHVIKENAKLKKEMEAAVRKATENAVRETERSLGVTRVTTASPIGSGSSSVNELTKQLADAASRGDKAKVSELRDAIYREVGIGR